MDTFSFAPTFPRTQSMQLVQGDHQFHIIPVANCLIIFEAYMEILFIIEVKILELIKWSSRSSPIMLTIGPRMVNKFWICSWSSLKRMSFWCLYLDTHLTTHHSIIVVWLKTVIMKGPRTLLISLVALCRIFGAVWGYTSPCIWVLRCLLSGHSFSCLQACHGLKIDTFENLSLESNYDPLHWGCKCSWDIILKSSKLILKVHWLFGLWQGMECCCKWWSAMAYAFFISLWHLKREHKFNKSSWCT